MELFKITRADPIQDGFSGYFVFYKSANGERGRRVKITDLQYVEWKESLTQKAFVDLDKYLAGWQKVG